VLVCLEGGSRGLDFKNVDLVVNVSPPESYREYVHRAGRTARMGRKGLVVTLCNRFEDSELMEGFVKVGQGCECTCV
jgi:superfamily II DNA/RNA helicase